MDESEDSMRILVLLLHENSSVRLMFILSQLCIECVDKLIGLNTTKVELNLIARKLTLMMSGRQMIRANGALRVLSSNDGMPMNLQPVICNVERD